jgi:phosphatidate cytidylyltransferase
VKRPPDLAARTATVLVGLPAAMALLWWAPAGGYALGLGLLAAASAAEFAVLLGIRRALFRIGAVLAAGSIPLLLHFTEILPPVPDGWTRLLVVVVVLVMVLAARTAVTSGRAGDGIGWLACVLYPAASLATLIPLRSDADGTITPGWVVLALAVCWGGDIGGYLAGSTMGHRPLAPRISPGKTWEGAVGSLVLAIALAWLVAVTLLPQVPLWPILALALGANILAQAGDLFESSLKRARGVKDSWWLDTMDGLALATPLLYLGRTAWVRA